MGGTVRDRLLGLSSPDIDVAVADDPRALAAAVAEETGLPWFALSHEFGAYRVVGERVNLDVVALRGGGIEADLALRDFTINAMALPLGGDSLVDPFDGRRHLLARRLAAVDRKVFIDDSLRLLRAVRLAHVLGFELDADLCALVGRHAAGLLSAAPERIAGEIAQIFAVPRAEEAVCLLSRLGLLAHLFPEVESLRGVPWGGGPEGGPLLDAYGHTMATLRALDDVLANPADLVGPPWAAIGPRVAQPVDGVFSRAAALRLAALFLEVGRVPARSRTPEGEEVFWGHAALGARLAGDAAKRLRSSKAVAGLLSTAVAEHAVLAELAAAQASAPRDLVRALWRLSPWEPEVLLLAWAANEAAAADGAGASLALARSRRPRSAAAAARRRGPDACAILGARTAPGTAAVRGEAGLGGGRACRPSPGLAVCGLTSDARRRLRALPAGGDGRGWSLGPKWLRVVS